MSKKTLFLSIIIAFLLGLLCFSFLIITNVVSISDEMFGKAMEKVWALTDGQFRTSKEHMEKLGIEIVNLPREEEKKLHSIIEEYYETKYFSDEEEEYKEYISYLEKDIESFSNNPDFYYKTKKDLEKLKQGIPLLPKFKILKIEFSQPRKYRDLEDRIGIISYISKTDPLSDDITSSLYNPLGYRIFIFKQTDGNWEIGNIRKIYTKLEGDESVIIQIIKEEIK